VLPVWRIHRHIGMGGDQLVSALAGEDVDDEKGDDIRAAEKALYLGSIESVEPFAGARELICDLRDRGRKVVLASSAKEQERLNRQLLELLNELRVALPGVQVLFAFLLAVPFQQRFAEASTFEKHVYVVTLLASAAATAFLIAPTGYHRLLFQRGDRPRIIEHGTRMLVAGLVCLALAMTGAVFLITEFIFSTATAVAIAAGAGAMFFWLWFGQALARRVRRGT